ncbi:uncharacterized protein C8R40DRAFT_1072025 [Lentinula edodes]|uniref:uncharacterized protein n=1 Tax=Lentinula edodes TaxID=5353 RepID=UPI001E8D16AF|nr:uncharacterized protein C8R40DRAFT_1072025 [Lentinula edodes]KAH7871922.1 hypothetical protein C8R40DRAFT_1072025 [Lentinula edodes]
MSQLVLYRAYSDCSGSSFKRKTGFVAGGSKISFDPNSSPGDAANILSNHLNWNNVHIPSPLISTTMSRSKANAKAKVISSRHRRTVYIAKIIVERDQVHHVCTLHKRLGLGKVPRHWRDDEEYVFVHRIPLSCIVEVVQWTGKALPRKENYIWENPAKTQRPAEQPPSPVLSYSAISGDLWDDPYNEQEKCEESLNHW